jgi:hypothetical protein
MCPGCNGIIYFNRDNCVVYKTAHREDTHNPNAPTVADLTKALFMEFAPLSQGVISGMRLTNDLGCC